MRESMTQFVRMHGDQRILEVSPEEARQLIATNRAGATATLGIVQFLRDWIHPTSGKRYSVGDFEKFDVDIPEEKAIADRLKAANIARPIDR
jgi:hypothetical protein